MLVMRLLMLLAFSLIILQSRAQKSEPDLAFPPNNKWLYKNISIDETEILNIHWLEYLYYLKKDSSATNFKAALPDTSVWFTVKDSIRSIHYLRNPGYRYFPVVGMNHSQAIDYCKWRTAIVNHSMQNDSAYRKRNSKAMSGSYKVFYWLPSEQEWMLAASGNTDINQYQFGYKVFKGPSSLKGNKRGYYKKVLVPPAYKTFKRDLKDFNKTREEYAFNVIKRFKSYFQYGDYAPAYAYDKRTKPNSIGLYQMIGNVAEMVSEEGISKGGSWFHYPDESEIKNRIFYTRPEPWLGFRCVCEVTPIVKN